MNSSVREGFREASYASAYIPQKPGGRRLWKNIECLQMEPTWTGDRIEAQAKGRSCQVQDLVELQPSLNIDLLQVVKIGTAIAADAVEG